MGGTEMMEWCVHLNIAVSQPISKYWSEVAWKREVSSRDVKWSPKAHSKEDREMALGEQLVFTPAISLLR